MDRYDHMWCIWVTAGGRRRRLDVMLVPYGPQWPYAVVGWTGSKQYLRFMRQHALNCGMFTNSHATLRTTPGGAVAIVPHEALPTDSSGREFEPPDWQRRGAEEQRTDLPACEALLSAPCTTAVASAGNIVVSAAAAGATGPPSLAGTGTTAAAAARYGSTGLRPVASERDICDLFRMPYRPPRERNA
ncbi:hypothetical protein GPECTOR_68g370 [Gonium pectorale]|uniref:Uncharacterized protein n=1 Tax=Gonium pectorale TaxID=33097 RepID=A0A150G3E4_GONPE|nr:hypothetical protein GPECTOR_68g370 [Gonium pectorale]|eukprot:KXZ44399.1 hypothetical protein GPECTOR_68g370 [Gonium pectorale]